MADQNTHRAISRAHDTILNELKKIGGRKKWTATNCEILCPFHNEKTPSCGVYIAPNGDVPLGYYYCLGCGAKGQWNKLAKHVGLKTIAGKEHTRSNTVYDEKLLDKTKIRLFKRRTDSIKKALVNNKLDFDREIKEEWRTIHPQLLVDIGARLAIDNSLQEPDEIVALPVLVRNEIITIIKAKQKKPKNKKQLSYVNTESEKVRDRGLFPYDFVKTMKPKYVVLVEGPRDALRLLMYGIPALAILGSQNWSEKKQRILLGLGAKVILCMDGDKAGRIAQSKIYSMIKNRTKVLRLNLSKESERLGEKVDPGNMDISWIKQFQKLNEVEHIGKKNPRYCR